MPSLLAPPLPPPPLPIDVTRNQLSFQPPANAFMPNTCGPAVSVMSRVIVTQLCGPPVAGIGTVPCRIEPPDSSNARMPPPATLATRNSKR